MRSFFQSRQYSALNFNMTRNAGRLAAIDLVGPDAAKDTTQSLKDLSIAAVTQKFCRYCKKKGHLIQECRKRARKQQDQSGPPVQASTTAYT